MGLKNDLYNAFVSNMSDAENEQIELTDFQKQKADELAENLKEAFINFLVNQTFTIKEMKAILEVESIKQDKLRHQVTLIEIQEEKV